MPLKKILLELSMIALAKKEGVPWNLGILCCTVAHLTFYGCAFSDGVWALPTGAVTPIPVLKHVVKTKTSHWLLLLF